MKNFLFALFFSFFCLTESSAQAPQSGSYVYIDWGRQSKGCVGFGICDIKVNMTLQDAVGIVTAVVAMNPSFLPEIQLVFDRLYHDNHKAQIQNGYFVIEEDYILSAETTRALKLPAGHRIKAGKYKVVFDSKSNKYNCTF